ncbi:MAG: hypothetical protein KF688_13820 [Pirellulales bacterium]|nr:hypothetical protein [Pirellulales bacterium]
MSSCLLLVDPPQSGVWNMAVDEALLAAADERGEAAIRIYRWSEPTLSLGYFQRAADRAAHAPSRDCPIVRRHSGGGALVHDRELTYAIALPATHPQARRPPDLYRIAHAALIEALAEQCAAVQTFACGELGCANDGSCSADGQQHGDDDQFLCFARRHPIDLVAANSLDDPAPKLVGSAQRRRRGALLQHGSLLLARSTAAPELPGIREACGVDVDEERLIAACLKQWTAALQLDGRSGELSTAVRTAVSGSASVRYGSASWTLRR